MVCYFSWTFLIAWRECCLERRIFFLLLFSFNFFLFWRKEWLCNKNENSSTLFFVVSEINAFFRLNIRKYQIDANFISREEKKFAECIRVCVCCNYVSISSLSIGLSKEVPLRYQYISANFYHLRTVNVCVSESSCTIILFLNFVEAKKMGEISQHLFNITKTRHDFNSSQMTSVT